MSGFNSFPDEFSGALAKNRGIGRTVELTRKNSRTYSEVLLNTLTKTFSYILLIQILAASLRISAVTGGAAICHTADSAPSPYLKPPVVEGDDNVSFFNAGKIPPSKQWTLRDWAVWLLGTQSSGAGVPLSFPFKMVEFPKPERFTENHGSLVYSVIRNELISSQPENSWQEKTFNQTRHQWRSHDRHSPAPAIVVSVQNYSVRFAVDPGLLAEFSRRIKNRMAIALLHVFLPHPDTYTLISFFEEWTSVISTCSSGSGDGDGDGDGNNDDNRGRACSYSVPPFSMQEEVVNPIPEPVSLLDQSTEATESLLAILKQKLQQAVDRGNRNLALVLRDRIMLIEVDLDKMEDLRDQRLVPQIAAWLRERLDSNGQEVEEKNRQLLQERLESHPQTVNLDPASLIIDDNSLSAQQTVAYVLWLYTPEGIGYAVYRKKLEQYLQDFEESGDGHDLAMPSLLSSLEILVQRFRQWRAPVPGIIQADGGSGDKQGSSSDNDSERKSKPDPKGSSESGTPLKPTNCKKGYDRESVSSAHTHSNPCPHRDCNNGPCIERSKPDTAEHLRVTFPLITDDRTMMEGKTYSGQRP